MKVFQEVVGLSFYCSGEKAGSYCKYRLYVTLSSRVLLGRLTGSQ
jgi:hypothetical protein